MEVSEASFYPLRTPVVLSRRKMTGCPLSDSQTDIGWAGEMARHKEHLPHKHEMPSFMLNTYLKS